MIIDTYLLNGTTINIHDEHLPKNKKEEEARKKQLEKTILKIIRDFRNAKKPLF